jgi:hypothetical protein
VSNGKFVIDVDMKAFDRAKLTERRCEIRIREKYSSPVVFIRHCVTSLALFHVDMSKTLRADDGSDSPLHCADQLFVSKCFLP